MNAEPCAICSSAEVETVLELPRFDLLTCASCSHVFSQLKVGAEDYGADYFLTDNAEHWVNPDLPLYARLDRMIRQHLGREAGELQSLDVGSAMGALPKFLGECGYESYGIDVSADAVKYGTETLGIPRLVSGSIDEYRPEAPFPVVTSIYVIEHVLDPVSFLEHIHRVLAPGGIFICITVDSNSILFQLARLLYRASGGRSYGALERICEVHHLHHFNRRSLARALSRAGLEIVERFQHNLPLRTVSMSPAQRLAVGSIYALSPLTRSYFLQGVVCRRFGDGESAQ